MAVSEVTLALLRENVTAGAAELDRVIPEWRTLVNWPALDMNNYRLCVLGQVAERDYGSDDPYDGWPYYRMIRHAFGVDGDCEWWEIGHGFTLPRSATDEAREALAGMWCAVAEGA